MNNLRQRDLQKISAYLDQEISRKEIQKFELRLQAEPALRAALREFERTKILMTRLPRISPPHNFTLTRAMAGKVKGRSFYSAFRIASILATVAFTVLVGADALSSMSFGAADLAGPAFLQDESLADGVEPPIHDLESQLIDEQGDDEFLEPEGLVAGQAYDLAVEEAEDILLLTPTDLHDAESDFGFGANTERSESSGTLCPECSFRLATEVETSADSAPEIDYAKEATPVALHTMLPGDEISTADLAQTEEINAAPNAPTLLPGASQIQDSRPAELPMLMPIAKFATGLAALLFAAVALVLRRAR